MRIGKGEIDEFFSSTSVDHTSCVNGVLVENNSTEDVHCIVLYIHNKYSLNCDF